MKSETITMLVSKLVSKSRITRLVVASMISAAAFASIGEPAAAAPKKPAKKAAKSQAKAKAKPVAAGKSRSALDMQREKSALPSSAALRSPVTQRQLGAVKPPRSDQFYEGSSKEAEYEGLVDQEIKALYRLSQQNKRSPNRGEIWLRLGERYVEKARLVEFRVQAEYEHKMKDYLAKKTRVKPTVDLRLSREYNAKAVQLYEWFVKDFPKDSKVDQALFFLGYNQFELDNPKLGEQHYLDLVKRFPNSAYVTESLFALGEYYFENEQWAKALESYNRVVAVKRARLNAFALYKSSWCYYRLGRTQAALQALERVVRLSRASEGSDSIRGGRAVNKVRLVAEALRDYVPFYAEAGDPRTAMSEFQRLSGNDKLATQMLERLAYIYADSGNRKSANYTFKQMISMDPTGPKSAEYQYQVVLTFATIDQKEFRRELDVWLEMFGPQSAWAQENAGNQKLVGDMAKLQETTIRNNVLQMHQTAQNARTEYAQKLASASYAQYFKHFPETEKAVEMRFFQAELLFDMQRYEEAAKVYGWVADKDPKGPYRERAVVNALLALEKALPSAEEIDAKRGKSIEPMPLDPAVAKFAEAAKKYIEAYPKNQKSSDIQRRLGVLYYSYNHFDEAMPIFEKILRDDPKSPNAEIAGNLMLDMFKLKGDMAGFAEKGQEMLKNPAIANSKFGSEIRTMIEKATFLRADKTAATDALKAGKEFEDFSTSFKASDLAAAARYKAASNYEKGGDMVGAMRMYGFVLAMNGSDPKVKALQNDSRNALARVYSATGQLELAAKQYRDYAMANMKDQQAVNGFYNAGVLFDGLGQHAEAMNAYQIYQEKSKNKDRWETIFAQAELQKRRGNITKASGLYELYLNSGPRSQAKAVQSAFEIATIAKLKDQPTKAKEWWNKTIRIYRNAGKSAVESVRFAAESRFELSQETMRELRQLRFTANDKQQAKAAVQMKQLRERYISEMKEVIRFDNAPWIVAALSSTGQMFDIMSNKLATIPIPAGFNADDAKKYRELMQVQINGFKTEATNSYKAAVAKSEELEAYTDWTQVARRGLATLGGQPDTEVEIAGDARSADWMGL
ncbi:MAG TPA: tetratricopeptide repeat protein [Bdellovibrionales bacterium]|nr:tetratricopeptide repeat protein [Bdellovibrionales bacterium]